jgi:hypothetical protein
MTDGGLITKVCSRATASIELLHTEGESRLARDKYVTNECYNVVRLPLIPKKGITVIIFLTYLEVVSDYALRKTCTYCSVNVVVGGGNII